MNLDEDIVQEDLCDLLSHFSKQTYSASHSDEKVFFYIFSSFALIVNVVNSCRR